jgi:hypothetical protein
VVRLIDDNEVGRRQRHALAPDGPGVHGLNGGHLDVERLAVALARHDQAVRQMRGLQLDRGLHGDLAAVREHQHLAVRRELASDDLRHDNSLAAAGRQHGEHAAVGEPGNLDPVNQGVLVGSQGPGACSCCRPPPRVLLAGSQSASQRGTDLARAIVGKQAVHLARPPQRRGNAVQVQLSTGNELTKPEGCKVERVVPGTLGRDRQRVRLGDQRRVAVGT